MRNLPVHWFEGLFLRPQHFQASDRYWEELMHTGMRWDHPYNYGIHAIEFSKEALANNRFEVSTLEVRMRDGTLVLLGDGEKPSEADLRPPKDGDGALLHRRHDPA